MTQVNVTQTDGMVSIIVGVAGTILHPVYGTHGDPLCVHVCTCAKARSGVFLPAAWLPKRIMIPVCAADMTSQVPRLLLEHQIMHPPDSQATFWSGQYLLCCSKLFPCRDAEHSPPLFLQRCEHGDMRTTTEETAGDSGHKSPS